MHKCFRLKWSQTEDETASGVRSYVVRVDCRREAIGSAKCVDEMNKLMNDSLVVDADDTAFFRRWIEIV